MANDVEPLAPPDPLAGYEELSAHGRKRESLADHLPPIQVQLAFLAVLATLYTLYFARELVLPIVLAMVFNLLLSPVVSWLHKLHIPRI